MIRRPALVAAALLLAFVWGSAAFLKSLDPAAFAEQITNHHVTPAGWSGALAILFIVVESLLALAHLSFWRPRLVFAASAGLLAVFMIVTGIAWANGHTEGCGCFGRLAARHPSEVLLEDAGFLLAAVVGFFLARDFAWPRWSGRALLAAAPLAIALPFVGPKLPFDSLVTTFRPGEDMTNLAADDLPGPLDAGNVLLALVGPGCAPCDAGIDALNGVASAGADGDTTAPQVIAVFAGSRAEARTWVLDHVPAFAVASAPQKVLRQYYRSLPQVGLLHEGKIVRVWRGRVPSVAELRGTK